MDSTYVLFKKVITGSFRLSNSKKNIIIFFLNLNNNINLINIKETIAKQLYVKHEKYYLVGIKVVYKNSGIHYNIVQLFRYMELVH